MLNLLISDFESKEFLVISLNFKESLIIGAHVDAVLTVLKEHLDLLFGYHHEKRKGLILFSTDFERIGVIISPIITIAMMDTIAVIMIVVMLDAA